MNYLHYKQHLSYVHGWLGGEWWVASVAYSRCPNCRWESTPIEDACSQKKILGEKSKNFKGKIGEFKDFRVGSKISDHA